MKSLLAFMTVTLVAVGITAAQTPAAYPSQKVAVLRHEIEFLEGRLIQIQREIAVLDGTGDPRLSSLEMQEVGLQANIDAKNGLILRMDRSSAMLRNIK